ncbi:asparaginase [Allopusillimonas soli]|uniref:Asparaginase n=1 Tax=Allopusillimonas soli TaxID=659016 RepID=A0A853FCZ7_9BURK|nr:asparaginase [Allopusillimonas soli]NYT37522.1 asparaginase [Allopusillimonas soli]TEA74504.1 asparaginase [Allopusillimonas soli]
MPSRPKSAKTRPAVSSSAQRPAIVVVGTGGTIASTASQATTLTNYTVTQQADALLAAVPGIQSLADISCMQIFNVDSRAITDTMRLRLARKVDRLLEQPDVDGVVITHGTDTMEETAYFLNLTIKSAKPVIVTGAMRPASALSADGPLNLYNAVLLAASSEAQGLGVLVMLNDRAHAARLVSKIHTTHVDAFTSGEAGCVAEVQDGSIVSLRPPARPHTLDTPFALRQIRRLPRVDILYDYQGAGLHLYKAAIEAGARGIVVAACGNGSLTPQAERGLRLAARQGVVCARSSRTGAGRVTPDLGLARRGILSADDLNAQKARLLLMLALSLPPHACTPDKIQHYFDRY